MNTFPTFRHLPKLLAVMTMFTPLIADAHILSAEQSSLNAGFQHPFHGLDHLLAMLAVGLWSAQLGRKHILWIPLSFVGALSLGGVLGSAGLIIPFVEVGIIISLIGVGALVAGAVKLPSTVGMILVGSFALFHGYAHVMEMPQGVAAQAYSLGFILATLLLHFSGILITLLAKKYQYESLVRYAGVCTVIAGMIFCF